MLLNPVRDIFRRARKWRFRYEPVVKVLIHRDAILHNYREFKSSYLHLGIAPVLKSNAYGHGLIQIAKIVDGERPSFICVDSFFEALMLENEGIQSPILVIGYTPIQNMLDALLTNTSFTIISLDTLHELAAKATRSTTIHLKIDTGMHRQGIMPEEIEKALVLIRSNPYLKLEGVCSHFADADTAGSAHTLLQVKRWNEIVKYIKTDNPTIRYFHFSATAGSFYNDRIEANIMRLGIGLYGINASLKNHLLHPALEMRSRISSIRTVAAGEAIGYNGTFIADRVMRIATVPVGYFEGVDRRLSNAGCFVVKGEICPIVGRVSMNITSIDVSSVSDISVNDEVVIISADPKQPNTLENIARTCNTIPHEILVHIPGHIRREVG